MNEAEQYRYCKYCGDKFTRGLYLKESSWKSLRYCSGLHKRLNQSWTRLSIKERRLAHLREVKRRLQHDRRARLRNAEGKFTQSEWEELKIKSNYACCFCNKSEPTIKLTIDHIIPLAKGGNNYISNIQPLCGSCNSSKKDKVVANV